MPDEPYLFRLATRLNAGLRRMEPARRARHRAFILSRQQTDGGFAGREGDSDLYYTSFAVRSLALLGPLEAAELETIGGYAKRQQREKLSVIDLVSWLYVALTLQLHGGEDVLEGAAENWADQVAATLESTRASDGGYAKTTEGAAGSAYHSFLVGLTYELIGRPLPKPNRLIQFLYNRQREDGGFVEIQPMKRSGTNPTAAAVALLNMFGGMDEEIRQDVRGFLREVRSGEGGFQANTRIPFADGLSTFTGLLTALDLGLTDVLQPDAAETFLTTWLEFPTGGFRGASWDTQADVEYTFYGLGCLALLWGM